MKKNITASVYQRLLNYSRAEGRRFNDVLQRYALERWLYRLSVSNHANKFILKGALMLSVWQLPVTRPTKDIDMLARTKNDLENIRSIVSEICEEDVEDDGFAFDTETITVSRIAEDALYEGVRSTFKGYLGKAQVTMQLDLGFSDVVTPGPISLEFPTILNQAAPILNAYNRETTIAEKLEAMVKLGELNSRIKDFYDIWMLASNHEFEGKSLTEAIVKTFTRRNTNLSPDAVCFGDKFGNSAEKQQQWKAFLRRSQLDKNSPELFVDAWRIVKEFLIPAMTQSSLTLQWSPLEGSWKNIQS